jgi:hypothetical protein
MYVGQKHGEIKTQKLERGIQNQREDPENPREKGGKEK